METTKKIIGVITISKFHFENYVNKKGLKFEDVKQISVLSDIKGVIFDYAVEVEGSENVTQYVIDRIITNK